MEMPEGEDWIDLLTDPLPIGTALEWVNLPSCGAVVLFTGVVRNHSEGRSGVASLTYEAFPEQAIRRLHEVAGEARRRWPVLGRLVLLHGVGALSLGEAAVVVVASAPHRADAFAAARYCIDALKETVPIWKREHWEGGSDWSVCGHPIGPVRPAVTAKERSTP